MHKQLLTILLLGLCATLTAQSNIEDVLYLKNGSIIRGTLKSPASENPLRIELLLSLIHIRCV